MRPFLAVLLVLSLDVAAAGAAKPPPLLARVYRFNIEWGCYEGGAVQGRERANIEASCACIVGELDRSLSADDWARAAQAAFKNDAKGESTLMGPHFRQAGESCRQTLDQTPAPSTALPALAGTWRWARGANQCVETFEYRADGTARVVSGKEVTAATYKVESATESAARYKLSMSITADNNLVDCAGSVEDATGASIESYIFVSDTAGAMVACRAPTGQDCIGPLFRDPD